MKNNLFDIITSAIIELDLLEKIEGLFSIRYNKYGLKYSQKKLSKVYPEIAKNCLLNIHTNAKYVDEQTKNLVDSGNIQNNHFGGAINYYLFNTTSIGNLSYVIAHCNIELSSKAFKILQDFQQWYKDKQLFNAIYE